MGNPNYVRINAHEKKILFLTLGEIAGAATHEIRHRISQMSDYDRAHCSWRVNETINDVVRGYVPYNTLRAMGVIVNVCSFGARAVATDCGFVINLSRSHPFCDVRLDRNKNSFTNSPFIIKRKRERIDGVQCLTFSELQVQFKEWKDKTVVQFIDEFTRNIIDQQSFYRDAAKTLCEFVEKHGEEELKKLSLAITRINKLPTWSSIAGTGYTNWFALDVLTEFGGGKPRMNKILDDAAAGKRIRPAGVAERMLQERIEQTKTNQSTGEE